MNRSGYVDDFEDHRQLAMYRGVVASVIRSKRGQAFLRELAADMDAMPDKALIAEELVTAEGRCCTIGVVCKARGVDVSEVDPEDPDRVAALVGIARQMAAEIEYENDEGGWDETPEQRWRRMRKWVDSKIRRDP